MVLVLLAIFIILSLQSTFSKHCYNDISSYGALKAIDIMSYEALLLRHADAEGKWTSYTFIGVYEEHCFYEVDIFSVRGLPHRSGFVYVTLPASEFPVKLRNGCAEIFFMEKGAPVSSASTNSYRLDYEDHLNLTAISTAKQFLLNHSFIPVSIFSRFPYHVCLVVGSHTSLDLNMAFDDMVEIAPLSSVNLASVFLGSIFVALRCSEEIDSFVFEVMGWSEEEIDRILAVEMRGIVDFLSLDSSLVVFSPNHLLLNCSASIDLYDTDFVETLNYTEISEMRHAVQVGVNVEGEGVDIPVASPLHYRYSYVPAERELFEDGSVYGCFVRRRIRCGDMKTLLFDTSLGALGGIAVGWQIQNTYFIPPITREGFLKTRVPDDVMKILTEKCERNEFDIENVNDFILDTEAAMVTFAPVTQEEYLKVGSSVGWVIDQWFRNSMYVDTDIGRPRTAVRENIVRTEIAKDVYESVYGLGLQKRFADRLSYPNRSIIDLELTSVYGLRNYHNGSILRMHTDKQATHVLSAILNIAQSGMEEDWLLCILDHEGAEHWVSMKPGDMLLYESARLVHGRTVPMKGKSYVNIFVHFKPTGAWLELYEERYRIDYSLYQDRVSKPTTDKLRKYIVYNA